MEIKIFDKLPKEAKLIRKLVFMKEQGFENEFDEIDNISKHIVLYKDSKAIGTCRIFYSNERNSYILGRLSILKEHRGENYGLTILKAAEKEVKLQNYNKIELSAQCRVADFYKKSDYKEIGEYYLDEGCPHTWMRKTFD